MKNPEGGPVCRCSTQDGETRRTRCPVGEAARRSGVIYLESWPVLGAFVCFRRRRYATWNGEPWQSGGEFLEGLLRVSFRRFGPDLRALFWKPHVANLVPGFQWTSSRNRTWNHRVQRRLVRPECRILGFSVPVARKKRIPDCCSHDVCLSERTKKLLLRAHKTRAGTHTHPHTHTPSHTPTPADTHSYTQYGNKPYAKCTRDHMHKHAHQMQLMPTSRSRNVLVVSPRHVASRVCILLNISSFIAGRRYPNNLSLKSRLNYTCGVLRSFNSGSGIFSRGLE